ncbi:tRNA pseudouridine32 synthase / 23S rRNA pseudouridine746 synthase [Stigmatella aurantiaca]|uniref:tRNA pseudouridine32 synthase / 23S rRNA pseudouridine746 synthase n=1 Tax=Stigmatella aurantiaca TaxID=41 RepID=A0A1H7WSP4_STIAU|nr:RluA family pseudouridine synthase [Stigmatella aurantiaca]SEM24513.1 tRNA pseudouridine32 synthase / 23S rRNA pseudouridine746 synthase [Stigmatella aurantiaca]
MRGPVSCYRRGVRPWVTPLEPPPSPEELPPAFPSPFDARGPHALAERAARVLQAELRTGTVAPGVPTALLEAPEGGKMFGVLAVQTPEGRIGFLRAFSGMLAGRWEHEGFVPPLFDRQAREALEPAGEATVKALHSRAEALRTAPERAQLQAAQEARQHRHARERAELKARHEARRHQRHARRQALTAASALSEEERRQALHALDQESRGDKAERRKQEAAQEQEQRTEAPALARLERRLGALERLRRIVCRALMKRIHGTYALRNARGTHRPLRDVFAPGEPPSGAADCAAPKLLAFAFAQGLRPLALAEFWWGAPPATGGRVSGAFYGACREKCGPLLPFLLEGLTVSAPRAFSPPVAPGPAGELAIVFEDAWLVVLDKPWGLLSVPGKGEALRDSVLTRLRARYPHAAGPLLVHRLDLDTSGLLVAALDSRTHAALQRQFLHREVDKRYVAWLDGPVRGQEGTIALPLRVDLHDRPRQIHDPVHGKPALTHWRVLERRGARTRVALTPHTGRTHQLRVHAAHPLGLGAPIVGDRLYGREEVRLLLHAEALAFRHPATGQRVSFERPAPF